MPPLSDRERLNHILDVIEKIEQVVGILISRWVS